MIISDTSPLIHLSAIGKLPFLLELFKAIGISNAVQEEAITLGIKRGYSEARMLEGYVDSNKIKVLALENEDLPLKSFLHAGEYESILLARTRREFLLMDEQKGRLVAEQNHIPVITTAGILLLLLEQKVINYDHYGKNLAKYAARGWLASDIYQKYLQAGKKYAEELP